MYTYASAQKINLSDVFHATASMFFSIYGNLNLIIIQKPNGVLPDLSLVIENSLRSMNNDQQSVKEKAKHMLVIMQNKILFSALSHYLQLYGILQYTSDTSGSSSRFLIMRDTSALIHCALFFFHIFELNNLWANGLNIF